MVTLPSAITIAGHPMVKHFLQPIHLSCVTVSGDFFATPFNRIQGLRVMTTDVCGLARDSTMAFLVADRSHGSTIFTSATPQAVQMFSMDSCGAGWLCIL